MLVSFSNFSSYTHESFNKFVSKADFERTTSEIKIQLEIPRHANISPTLNSKLDISVFESEIDRLDAAVSKQEDWITSQLSTQDSQQGQLIAIVSQLEGDLKTIMTDVSQLNEIQQGKASKVAVATALKKRVSHEELDVAVQQIIEEVNELMKRQSSEGEEKWKRMADKVATLETNACSCNSAENSAPIVLLERQLSKNFAEINRMLEHLKPDRTELQQLEDSLENHFKLISGISQELVDLRHAVQQSSDTCELHVTLRQSVQHTEAAVEAQQTSILKVSKGMQELHKQLGSKVDKEEIDLTKAAMIQVDRHLKDMETRLMNHLHDHSPKRPPQRALASEASIVQTLDELIKIVDCKADREDISRISKMVIDLESSNHWYQEEDERRQAGMLRQVRSEVERYARSEIDRYIRTELELFFHNAVERKEAEWKEERQEELAVKVNLAELHSVRKETTELASRILAVSKELHDLQASLPRRLETLYQASRDSTDATNNKGKSDLQLRVSIDQLYDEVEQLKTKMKKKVEKGEFHEVVKSWQDASNSLPTSPSRKGKLFVTKEELMELLKQKVDFNELVNSLSLKIDKNDLQSILSTRDTTKLTPDHSIREWVEHVVSQLEQTMHDKVDLHEFSELKEQVQKKLDISVYLQGRTEIADNSRKLDRELRDLFHTLRLQHPPNLTLVHTTPPSPSKKQAFLNQTTATITNSQRTHSHIHTNYSATEPVTSNNNHSQDKIPTINSDGGRWFKDVKPSRYLEILKELNRGLSKDRSVS